MFNKLKRLEKSKYSLYIAACEFTRDIFQRVFSTEKVIITGYPRNDILFNYELYQMESIHETLETDNYNAIILYAPTYRELNTLINPLADKDWRYINEKCADNNILFLIKQHPYANSINFSETLSNVKDISSKLSDIQELLYLTDILITDYSSVMFDYSLLNRPIILFIYDYDDYKNNVGFYIDLNDFDDLLIIKEKDAFLKLFSNVELLINRSLPAGYKRFVKKYNKYQDGNSSARIFEYLKKAEEIK